MLSVNLDDPKTANQSLVSVVRITDDGEFGPGEIRTWTASITLDSSNVNNDSIENLAALTGVDVLNTPVLVDSGPVTGNDVPGAGNGAPNVVQFGDLIEAIKGDLTAILEDHLRVTIERLARMRSGFAKEALARLKAGEPESYGAQPDKGGSFSAMVTDRQIVIEGSNESIVDDCAKHEWRISAFDGSLRSLDGFGDQAKFSYTLLREWLVYDDSLRGRFICV